jgi:hypothetical protein
MHEIDQLLFLSVDIPFYNPRLDARDKKSIQYKLQLKQFKKMAADKQVIAIFKKFSRITGLMFPHTSLNIQDKLVHKIPGGGGEEDEYTFYLTDKLPSYTFMPSSLEIIHRLILKAASVESVYELFLTKSKC